MDVNHSRIEIFGVPQSNFTRAVRIACEEKSIHYDYHAVPPHSPDVVAIHPLGKIPVLRHGDLTLVESWPIVSYLDRLFPDKPMVLAGGAALTAEVEQWVSIVAMSVDPVLVRKYVLGQYLPVSEVEEIALARNAAPASLSKDAEVMVLGDRGYRTAVRARTASSAWYGAPGRTTLGTRSSGIPGCARRFV